MTASPLRRSDPNGTGIQRRRRGRGFTYLGSDATAVKDPGTLARIKALVIPPAWQDVWICADPRGHIQAIGTDAAGRRQYRYHDLWRQQRDQDKHDRVEHFGAALPAIREAVGRHLDTRGLARERVLAAAIRLIDLGFFRPGGEEYAEQNGTFGLATIRKDHVTLTKGQLVFDYRQGCQAARAGGSRRSGVRRRAEPAAAGRRRRPAAGLPGRLTLARRHRRGHQRLPA
jgi:DNA topoisomerase IB